MLDVGVGAVVAAVLAITLGVGAEFRLYNQNFLQPGAADGNYTFSKGFTQANPLRADAVSGNEFASFLLGYPSSGSEKKCFISRHLRPRQNLARGLISKLRSRETSRGEGSVRDPLNLQLPNLERGSMP